MPLLILLSFFIVLQGCSLFASGWSVGGESPHDNFGTKVAPAGDVNGDGFADIAVWSPGHGNGAGKVYIYLGSPSGPATLPAWSVQGEGENDQYGHSFGTIGDVNGDGFSDFIAAAQGYDASHAKDAGKAYVYLGSSKGLSPTPAWVRTGSNPFELFGDCSGPAGDINGDGLGDVVIGAYGRDSFKGMAYVFLGARGGLSSGPAWTAKGERTDDWFGYSVASCANLKGDGFPALVIGGKQHPQGSLQRAGKVYAYYGSRSGFAETPSWTAQGETEGELFGWRALPTGDVLGNGRNGVIVSGYMFGNDQKHFCGKVYAYLAGPQGLPAKPDWTFEGESDNSLLGYSIASGDFDGDGHSDLLVGAPHFGHERGRIYLFKGGAQGLPERPSWVQDGFEPGEQFGAYVANVGDVNGDGVKDLAVGAPDNSRKSNEQGRVYLLYGQKNGNPHTSP